jgi:hypothetical protein
MSNKAHRARRDQSEPAIIEALEAGGWCVRKIAQRGLPDLLLFKAGQPLSIRLAEAKTGKAKLRETQNWAAAGLIVAVFRSIEDVLAWQRDQGTER